jgi:hypothetical protein
MEEMKWSSKSLLGVLAANNLGFGLTLAENCQTFGKASNSAKGEWHGVSKIRHTEPKSDIQSL